MSTDDEMPDEGWYPDPDGKPAERYWDGDNWTDRTRPIVTSSSPEPEPDASVVPDEPVADDRLPDPPAFLDERQQAEYRAHQEEVRNRQRGVAVSTKTCPQCGATNELAKRLCVDCGAPIAKVKPDDPGQGSIYDEAPGRRREWVRPALFVGALGVLALVISLCNSGGGSEAPSPDDGDALSAYVVCQQFVEEQLRAPGTADYPQTYSEATTDLGGGRYRVNSFVDAENAFGALIRTRFVCTVEHVSGDRYSLVQLRFPDQ